MVGLVILSKDMVFVHRGGERRYNDDDDEVLDQNLLILNFEG
jgi:hypothetical protein